MRYAKNAEVVRTRRSICSLSAWAEQRRVLTDAVGDDLSLPTVIYKMVGSESVWGAVVFCENVISRKEAAEREREDDPVSLPLRCRRDRIRRRRMNCRLL